MTKTSDATGIEPPAPRLDDGARTTAPEVRSPTERLRHVVVFPLIAAFLLFFGPGLAYVVGDRAEAVENRTLAQFPSLELGWGFLPAFGGWAIDHLPLRSEAVLARTRISEAVFSELPKYATAPGGVGVAGVGTAGDDDRDVTEDDVQYPQVIEGRDGWLFYGVDVSASCNAAMSVSEITANLQRLADAASASGRRLVIAIAPDKSSAHPELLPDAFAGKACMEQRRAQFWSSIGELDGVHVVDPSQALAAFESETGRSVWRPNDTHWGPAGAAVFSKSVAEALDARFSQTSIVTGPDEKLPGDLSQMVGDLKSDAMPTARIDGMDVTLRHDGNVIPQAEIPDLDYRPITVTTESTGFPLIPGKTLLLGDSFFAASRLQFPLFYSSLTYVHSMSAEIPGSADVVADVLAESDNLIFEMVERSAVGGHVAFQRTDAIDTLIAAMEANPRK
jgi:alginate O-acetyltransferase complex protein AlgJ